MVQKDWEYSQHTGAIFSVISLSDGTIAGVADYVPSGYTGLAYCAFINLLMIGQPWRGRGLGTAVLRKIEQQIWTSPDITTLRTAVQINNPGAIHFWERRGFTRIGGPLPQPDGTTTYLYEKKRELGERYKPVANQLSIQVLPALDEWPTMRGDAP
jgi:N-acetylglutamate synthase-like GNAT family acetyltransferase